MPNNIAKEVEKIAEDLGIDRKRSIGEVAKDLKIKTHVIRFWEENFPQIKPEIGAGDRRYYYNKQLKILRRIKKFLYEEGYTIAGLKKLLGRKIQDDRKEEDLAIIAKETPEFAIDDFINPEVKIKTGVAISSEAKLFDFKGLKVSDIDPKIKKEIKQSVQNVRQNLKDFKSLFGRL